MRCRCTNWHVNVATLIIALQKSWKQKQFHKSLISRLRGVLTPSFQKFATPSLPRTVWDTGWEPHVRHTHSQIMCDALHKQLIGLISWQVTYILLRCTPSFSPTDQPRVSAPRENHPLWVTPCPRDISSYETHNMAAWLNNPSSCTLWNIMSFYCSLILAQSSELKHLPESVRNWIFRKLSSFLKE